MKKVLKFSEKPRIKAERVKRYYMLSINCTPYFLSESALMKLNVLKQKYAHEKRIGYDIDIDETDIWFSKVLADDINDFWNKVKEILMEEGSFIMRWPEKWEGNLLQLQNRYKEKEITSKQATVLGIAKMHGGN